jgi:hypothetical protein
MFFADHKQNEAFAGEMEDPNRKLIYGSTDDRGRVKSEYFTDERGRLKIPYGEMFEHSHSSPTSISLTTADTYYGWVSATDGDTYGSPYITFEDNATADRLRIGQEGAGVWLLTSHYSLASGGVGFTLGVGIFINGTIHQHAQTHRELSGANDLGAMGITAVMELEGGDYVDLRFTSDTNSKSVNVHHVTICLTRVNHKR